MTDDSTIDPFTGEALLDGAGRVPGDALSELLDALGSPALPSETAGGASTVGGMVANVTAAVAAGAPSSRRRLTTRVGALAVAGSMCLSGVAAAAVGVPVPVISEVVPVVADLVPGGTEPSAPASDGSEQLDDTDDTNDVEDADTAPAGEGDAPPADGADPATDTGPDGTSPGDEKNADDELGPGNSDRARSDCGKPDAVPTGDEECDNAENHGDHVRDGVPNGNGRPGEQGPHDKDDDKGNGKDDDKDNGKDTGRPDEPGTNGNGAGQGDGAGTDGSGQNDNGQSEESGKNAKDSNGSGEPGAKGNGAGGPKTSGPDADPDGQLTRVEVDEGNVNGKGGEVDKAGRRKAGRPDDAGSAGNGKSERGGGAPD